MQAMTAITGKLTDSCCGSCFGHFLSSTDQMQLSKLKLWLEYHFLEVHKKLDTLQNEVKKKRMKKVSKMFKVLYNCWTAACLRICDCKNDRHWRASMQSDSVR